MPTKPRRKTQPRARTTQTHLFTKVTAVGLIALIAYIIFQARQPANSLGPSSPTLRLHEALWLRARLSQNFQALTQLPGQNTTTQDLYVEPGDTATDVSHSLAQLNVVSDESLLRDYLLYTGIDAKIKTGFFQFPPGMTTVEVATALTNALPSQIEFHMWAGWRLEEVADALSGHPHLSVDRNSFLAFANRLIPLPDTYIFTQYIPGDATLEGFLYPQPYIFPPRADAYQILSQMLSAFDTHTDRFQALAQHHNLTLIEFVTLASIVERETIIHNEASLIAGVFLHRLALQMPLGADPTVQYALASRDNWWPALTTDPRLVDHRHNTYVHIGLPPSPIASPSRATLESVGGATHTDFLYFRAACDESGTHNFSRTYSEHLLLGCGA